MIKKILFILSLFFIGNVVYAEKFTIGDYISGEYIKMVNDETSKYLTIQKINDSRGNFVYCIEPFILVDESTEDYTTYVKDLSGYKSLSEEQKRRISLIAYYGYGYKDRMVPRWYAVTQMLIWKTVDPDSDFYFTDTINGNKINKYEGEMGDILRDVSYHDSAPTFIKDYTVNYGDELVIQNYNDAFSIDSTYNYKYNSSSATLTVSNVIEDGTFIFEKEPKKYSWDLVIYDNATSQDLIKPGSVLNKLYTINVKVKSGDITLDIRKDNRDVYSIESDFSNTCYEINNGEMVIDTVCTGNDDLIYKTDKLPYGEYVIKQVSVGTGYEVDNNEYKVIIDGTSDTNVVLNNKLIQNKIELVKYHCINDDCLYEENAIFNVFDKDNQLVGSITTDVNGYGYLDVGYGKYTIIQEDGLDNYTFVDIYTEDILNSQDKHYKKLYNYYIEDAVEDFGTVLPDIKDDDTGDVDDKDDADEVDGTDDTGNLDNTDEVDDTDEVDESDEVDDVVHQDIIKPPYTGTKLAEILKIVYNVIMVVICSCNLKRFCYNN